MEKIPFLGASYEARSLKLSAQKTVNMYLDKGTDGDMALMPFFGLKSVATVGTGPHRGAIEHGGNMYVVSGKEVYKVTDQEVISLAGTMNTGAGDVGMASNGTYLIIVDGQDGWLWDGSTLDQITDADFVDAVQIVFLDGYFIVNKPGTGEFYISGLYPTKTNLINGSGWTSLDYATAEADPDNLLALYTHNRLLWLPGKHTTEIYYNSGHPDFPFERAAGGFIEWGIAAPWSMAKIGDSLVWLARNREGDGYVVRSEGFNAARISDSALEAAIAGYSRIDDAKAMAFQYMGQSFYMLTFPAGNATWAYHLSANDWYELKRYDAGRHPMNTHCLFNGKHYVGDYNSGKLYTLDKDTYTNAGETIERIRRTRHISKKGRNIFWHRLQVDVESGVGLTSGQGSDPQVMIRWSKDGGKTWSNAQWRSLGKIGEYKWRAIVDRLGVARDMTFEAVVTDPVKFVIRDAYASYEVGE